MEKKAISEIMEKYAAGEFTMEEVNEKLKNWSARRFMAESNVKAICTTDDPIDDLQWHKKMAADPTMPARVLPAFRPDRMYIVINGKRAELGGYIAAAQAGIGNGDYSGVFHPKMIQVLL